MRQDVYRVAHDEAHAELLEISKRFDELRQRKESLESVVAALCPMLGVSLPTQTQQLAGDATEPVAQASAEPVNYTFNQVQNSQPEESITDPFQQRVRNALKFSSNNNGHDHKGLQPAM
jgi:hypothetical protein